MEDVTRIETRFTSHSVVAHPAYWTCITHNSKLLCGFTLPGLMGRGNVLSREIQYSCSVLPPQEYSLYPMIVVASTESALAAAESKRNASKACCIHVSRDSCSSLHSNTEYKTLKVFPSAATLTGWAGVANVVDMAGMVGAAGVAGTSK